VSQQRLECSVPCVFSAIPAAAADATSDSPGPASLEAFLSTAALLWGHTRHFKLATNMLMSSVLLLLLQMLPVTAPGQPAMQYLPAFLQAPATAWAPALLTKMQQTVRALQWVTMMWWIRLAWRLVGLLGQWAAGLLLLGKRAMLLTCLVRWHLCSREELPAPMLRVNRTCLNPLQA
jgi:hypothetical protein